MRTRIIQPAQRRQRGQTLLLVAASLFTLVAMAALAIDLTTLYTARSEMQRAADAAALAGAKAFVDSGTTTDPTNGNLQNLATTLARAYITAALPRNTVGGVQPTVVGGGITPDYTHPGNPQITIKLQRTDLPTFFSRIFGRRLATVSATATAEAYNSSLPPGGAGNMPPVAPSCVKPWLVPNIDPDHGNTPFVNTDGSIANPGVWSGTCFTTPGTGGVIGECITLYPPAVGAIASPITNAEFLPAALTAAPSGTCPSCAGGSNFEQSISCCDTANAAQYACGATTSVLSVGSLVNVPADTFSGAACLVTNATNTNPILAPDQLQFANFQSSGGTQPLEIRSGTGAHFGQFVDTSNQIVTLPIISTTLVGLQATVIGYMQVFVQRTANGGPVNGGIELYVLNISGCGTNINTAATPVSGGGASPVPVRLIN